MRETRVPTHQPVEFECLNGHLTPEKLAICNYGEHGTGKTRLIATAPDVGVIPLDRKTRGTIERVRAELNPTGRIWFPKIDFIRQANPMALAVMSPEDSIKYYRKHVDRIKDACWTLADPKHPCRTIGIDSGSQLWEDILFANYGRNQKIMPRDRGSANQEMKDLLNSLQGKHLIITHRAREVWKNEKPTGTFDVAGFADIGYYVNVLVEHERGERDGKFSLSARMCQANASLHGDAGRKMLEGDDITFLSLAMKVYGDGDDVDLTEYI